MPKVPISKASTTWRRDNLDQKQKMEVQKKGDYWGKARFSHTCPVFFDFFLTFSHFLYDRNASCDIYPLISLYMMKNVPHRNTVSVDLFVRDFLVDDVWQELKSCSCEYDDMLFDLVFKKTWNSYGSTLHNK